MTSGRLCVSVSILDLKKTVKSQHYTTSTLYQITHKLAGASVFSEIWLRIRECERRIENREYFQHSMWSILFEEVAFMSLCSSRGWTLHQKCVHMHSRLCVFDRDNRTRRESATFDDDNAADATPACAAPHMPQLILCYHTFLSERLKPLRISQCSFYLQTFVIYVLIDLHRLCEQFACRVLNIYYLH